MGGAGTWRANPKQDSHPGQATALAQSLAAAKPHVGRMCHLRVGCLFQEQFQVEPKGGRAQACGVLTNAWLLAWLKGVLRRRSGAVQPRGSPWVLLPVAWGGPGESGAPSWRDVPLSPWCRRCWL